MILVTTGPQPLYPIMEPFWTLNTAQMGLSPPPPSKIKRTLCHVPTMLYNYFLSFDSDCLHKKMDVLSLKTTEETRIQSFKQNASSIMLLGLARDL